MTPKAKVITGVAGVLAAAGFIGFIGFGATQITTKSGPPTFADALRSNIGITDKHTGALKLLLDDAKREPIQFRVFDGEREVPRGHDGVAVIRGRVMALRLTKSSLVDMTPVKTFPGLIHLDLSGNRIAAIAGLDGHTALETLNLSGNGASLLAPIEGAYKLREINLADNKLKHLEGLIDLRSLENLNAANNVIDDVADLAALATLKWLDLSGNKLDDDGIEPLVDLPKLQRLDVRGNPLKAAPSGLDRVRDLMSDFE